MSASGIGGAFYRVFVQTTFNIAGAGAGQDISGNLQILGFFILRAIVTRLRAARVKRQIAEKLLPVLERRASGVPHVTVSS